MRRLFILATFVGSFALFLLEPMVAKALLPSFGGSSLVWNGCLLFFQAALLAGYAYANTLSNRAKVHSAAPIHWVAIGIALALTAGLLVPGGLWHVRPGPTANPLGPLLLTLMLTTAAPFIVLAAGTPLIQRWFAQSDDPHAHDPYFLYAASNLGSFCGLIAFPVLIEPRLTLAGQRLFVFGLFVAYAAVLVTASAVVRKRSFNVADTTAEAIPPEPITPVMRARWAALSAAPSALLLAVTSDITKNIAPIPLLWVVPLGLYLLTFVIVFSKRARALEAEGGAPTWLQVALALALAGNLYAMLLPNPPIVLALGFAAFGFFTTALACHLQLARLRPSASRLTDYYMWVSIGGVLGGLFCALLAPLIFTGLTELPLAFAACVGLYAFLQPREKFHLLDVVIPAVALGAILYVARGWGFFGGTPTMGTLTAVTYIAFIFVATSMWPRRFTVVFVATLALFFYGEKLPGVKTLFKGRNFYGYETVTLEQGDKYGETKRLVNGNILHGIQYTDPVLSRRPTTYYATDGPLGEALLPTLDAHPNARIAAVGLGSGTEAAYGPGMSIDFYELNPAIERIARNPKLFTYLRDSKAKISVTIGDARLSLVNAPSGAYDVIILDAFSSDSIPIHLLTAEAMEMYKSKLKPDGLLLVHASSRYLDLTHVVAATGASVGLACDLGEDGEESGSSLRYPTTWLGLATSRDRLKQMEGPKNYWAEFHAKAGTQPWTDDYSNVFRALKVIKQ